MFGVGDLGLVGWALWVFGGKITIQDVGTGFTD